MIWLVVIPQLEEAKDCRNDSLWYAGCGFVIARPSGRGNLRRFASRPQRSSEMAYPGRFASGAPEGLSRSPKMTQEQTGAKPCPRII